MRASKATLLASLYLSQGLPFGFLTQAVPALLREEGASLTTIGDTSLLLSPWLLKFLWAPLVDRYGSARFGRRRSWIIPLQLLSVGVLLVLAARSPVDVVPVLLVATFVTSLISATQDIATDGLAVRLLNHDERGLGNGIQVAGYRLGMVVGGGALLVVYAWVGWSATFLAMAGILAVATFPVLLMREPADEHPPEGLPYADMWRFVTRPGVLVWLVLLVGYKLGEQIGGSVTRPMLTDLGLDLGTIGWLSSVDSAFAVGGALAGGLVTTTLGRRRAVVGLGLLQATGVLAWALPTLVSGGVLFVAFVKVYDGFVGSMATAALFTAMMDVCDPDRGGTEYTVQASVVLVAGFLGSLLGGRLGDALIGLLGMELGYATHYAAAASLTAAGALAIAWSPKLQGARQEQASR